jgi:RHS repeat-associated protein
MLTGRGQNGNAAGAVAVLSPAMGKVLKGHAAGGATDSYVLEAFGLEVGAAGSTVNPYRYAGPYGYYRDTANRMYVRARFLDAVNGRWVSRDLIGFDGGDWNLYRYVGNGPVAAVDPSGLSIGTPPTDEQLYEECVALCWKNYQRRNTRCRKMVGTWPRRLCWAKSAARYSVCLVGCEKHKVREFCKNLAPIPVPTPEPTPFPVPFEPIPVPVF